MTAEDRDILSDLRTELAALGRDVTYVQREITQIRANFARLVWLVMATILVGLLEFVFKGGLIL